MTTEIRRPARDQELPQEEALLLRTLKGSALHRRAAQLYQAGWTLRSIGDAILPQKKRSTVSGWISALPALPEPDPTIPAPVFKEITPSRPTSPGISQQDLLTIQTLAPSARRYRSGMGPNHPARRANEDLTDICSRLYAQNVTVAELADAAGVSYRAMTRRLGNP